jgi:predicted acylesterase/phospholipase RssA
MTRAIVLTGDASRGAWQAGALMQLLGNPPDAVYGVSSGALNAALYNYCGASGIESQWTSIKSLFDIYQFNWVAALWRPALFNNEPLVRRIEKVVADGTPKCTSFAVVSDVKTSIVHYIPNTNERYAESVASSATIPGLCAPLNSDWMDGGIRELAPIQKALDDGHDDITLVLSRPYNKVFDAAWAPWKGPFKAAAYAMRAVDIMLHEIAWNEIEHYGKLCRKLTVYAPQQVVQSKLLEFDTKKIRWALEDGQRAKPLVIA